MNVSIDDIVNLQKYDLLKGKFSTVGNFGKLLFATTIPAHSPFIEKFEEELLHKSMSIIC